MIKDTYIKGILKDTADECNVGILEVESVVESAYKFIYEAITPIPFKDMSLEEFKNTKKNFTMPGLFKLYADEGRFIRINKLYKK